MFTGILRLVSFCFLASLAVASPVSQNLKRTSKLFSCLSHHSDVSVASSTALVPVSLDNWGGFSVLSNFDSFFGVDDFCGLDNAQVLLEQELVCGLGTGTSISSIDVVQQQLAILSQVAQQ